MKISISSLRMFKMCFEFWPSLWDLCKSTSPSSPTFCLVLTHLEQFVLLKYSGICDFPKEYDQLSGATLLEKTVSLSLQLTVAQSSMAGHGVLRSTAHLHARILSDLGLQQSCTCGHNCYECVHAVAFLLGPVGILVLLLYLWESLAILIIVVIA